MQERYSPYTVTKKVVETPTTSTLWLAPQSGVLPDFIPGQFVDVSLPQLGPEAKSYTISSTPKDDELAITVRAAGNFSRSILAHEPGDTIRISEPYGYFYPEDTTTPRVFLAGGIGVTPFMSIMRSEVRTEVPETTMLYSSRTADDIAFKDELAVHAQGGRMSLQLFVTREAGSDPAIVYERIGPAHIRRAAEEAGEAHFFLCGGIGFVRDMRLHLKALGVSEDAIYTESFY